MSMENYLEKNWKDYFKDLQGLVKIPSFLTDVDDYPNIHQKAAVKYMEELAKAHGMKVFTNPEGFYGYIEIGQGKEMIGLLGHLDVVDPGELDLWKTDPFELIQKDGNLIGRGAVDDKGPLLILFYLMKEIVESKIKLDKRIRLIYATDEESLWRGITKYVENGEEVPTMGWTSDCEYPPMYGEKTIYEYKLSLKEELDFELNGGSGSNSVSTKATYRGAKVDQVEAEMKKLGYKYEINKDGSLSALGVGAHAMRSATDGVNANSRLVQAVAEVEDSKFLKFLAKYIGIEKTGDTLFRKHFEDETGSITNNFGIIKTTPEGFTTTFDSRIPIFAAEWEDIEKAIIESCKEGGVDYKFYNVLPKLYVDKDGEFIQSLLNTYKKFSGDAEAEPVVIGGGTYARSMPNIVAFGPYFKDSPDTEHQPNEYARISDLTRSYSIYTEVIEGLLK